jgi:cell division protein FtsQ
MFAVMVIAYLVLVSGFISTRERTQQVRSISICVVDSVSSQLLKSKQVYELLAQKKFNILGRAPKEIKLEAIEKSLKTKQIIKDAEAYITEPGVLHVDIRQKSPFLRIFNKNGQGYYLDKEGNIIPVLSNYSPFVIVASGNITEPFRIGQTLNIFSVNYDTLNRMQQIIYDLHKLASFISENDFWSSQIEQIYVNSKYEFELIPRVGSNIIEIGRAEDLDVKFNNLMLLYHNGFNNLGWNQYEKISLKYKNQIVCTKNY